MAMPSTEMGTTALTGSGHSREVWKIMSHGTFYLFSAVACTVLEAMIRLSPQDLCISWSFCLQDFTLLSLPD